MEGLIPLVYKAVRSSHTRRKYRCLSHGPAQRLQTADNYVSSHSYVMPAPEKLSGFHEEHVSHRRAQSFDKHSTGRYSPEKNEGHKLSKVVRARSSRMFACIVGA
ncbi:hypothetical protein ACLOJK_011640 [Asimina triloba]